MVLKGIGLDRNVLFVLVVIDAIFVVAFVVIFVVVWYIVWNFMRQNPELNVNAARDVCIAP